MQRTLTRKIMLGGITLLLTVALAAAFIITSVMAIDSTVGHLTHQVLEEAMLSRQFNTQAYRSLMDAESFARTHDLVEQVEALEALHDVHDVLDQLNAVMPSDGIDPEISAVRLQLQQERKGLVSALDSGVRDVLRATADNDMASAEHTLATLGLIENSIEALEDRSEHVVNHSKQVAETAVANSIERTIVISVVLFGLFALAVLALLLFMRQSIVRPIRQLSAVTRMVADGDLDQTIAITNDDEIGSLQATFNHMITALRMAGETVAEYQAALEARVAERTADLQAREAYFRALIEHSTDGKLLTARDGTIRYGSPGTERILGYPVQDLVGHTALDLVHPNDRPSIAEQLAWLRHHPYASLSFQARLQHADGTWRDLEGTCTNLLDNPAVEAIVSNYRDITERKQIEHELEEERALLARRVEERTADLRAANVQLAHAARLKDEFLASMSHELRTPLNTILGMAETLQEGVLGVVNDRQTHAVHHIEESGRHLLALINDILDVSKIEAGKLDLTIEAVEVVVVAQASLRLISQLAHQKGLRVVSSIDSSVGMLSVDARRLKQMLANLLANAAKFTPDGGTIGLEVVGDRAAQCVHLTVWDTGIGIAAADLPRLFQPFVQLDSGLARQYSGTGLGLVLVQRMAELHGGSVAVESTLGEGSRFTITLPWTAAVSTTEPSDTNAPATLATVGRAPIARALIIEDSPTAAAQLARYVRDLGVEVGVHPRGVGALEVALEMRPDVILLDIQLPDFCGWDVLARFKTDPRLCAIPVVIVSVVDDQARGQALGATAYLVKPVSRQQVQDALSILQPDRGFNIMDTAFIDASMQALAPPAPLILLAEDEVHNRYTLSTYLEAKGYQVVLAQNGAEAITRARDARPDLMLMDIQMPGMDGLEAMQHLRSDPNTASVPLIALTALAMPGDRERCLAAGADDVLTKPVKLKELVTAIEARLSTPCDAEPHQGQRSPDSV